MRKRVLQGQGERKFTERFRKWPKVTERPMLCWPSDVRLYTRGTLVTEAT